jgi:hypothetical protein
MLQGERGRNRSPLGFTVWLAGGGVRGGQSIGATDEIGLRAERDPYHPKQLHATILQALGLRCGVAGSAQPIPGVLA